MADACQARQSGCTARRLKGAVAAVGSPSMTVAGKFSKDGSAVKMLEDFCQQLGTGRAYSQ